MSALAALNELHGKVSQLESEEYNIQHRLRMARGRLIEALGYPGDSRYRLTDQGFVLTVIDKRADGEGITLRVVAVDDSTSGRGVHFHHADFLLVSGSQHGQDLAFGEQTLGKLKIAAPSLERPFKRASDPRFHTLRIEAAQGPGLLDALLGLAKSNSLHV